MPSGNEEGRLEELAVKINREHELAQDTTMDAVASVLRYVEAVDRAHEQLSLDGFRAWLSALDRPIDDMYEMVAQLLEVAPSAVLEGAQNKLGNWMLEARAN